MSRCVAFWAPRYAAEGGCGRGPCMPSQTSPTDSGPTSISVSDMLEVVASILTNNRPPAVMRTVSSNEMRKKEIFVMAAVLPIGAARTNRGAADLQVAP